MEPPNAHYAETECAWYISFGWIVCVSTHAFMVSTNVTVIYSACIAGAVRLHVIRELTTSGDLSWNMSQTLVWSSIEPSIGIICACLPTIGPLIRRFLPKWFGGSSLKPSSRPAYGTDSRRPHSRNGGFYALHSRTKDPHKNKSDDELGLRNDIKSDHDHQPQDRSKDSMAFDSQNAIIVKRDIEWSSTSVFS